MTMSSEDAAQLVANFSTHEMMTHVGEIDKETEESSNCGIVTGWTPDDEREAKQTEMVKFDNYDVWELVLRDKDGPKPLTWTRGH